MRWNSIQDYDLHHQRVLMRVDFNVPLSESGEVLGAHRLRASLNSIQSVLRKGACLSLISHWGRPKEGCFEPQYSLKPVHHWLEQALGQKVVWVGYQERCPVLKPGECALMENVRFNLGEKSNSRSLGESYAQGFDLFVMEAFAVAHRCEASTVAVAQAAPQACVGSLLQREIQSLDRFLKLKTPSELRMAVLGGSKLSTKLPILLALKDKIDCLFLGGGMLNTFLAAQGIEVGQSCFELGWAPQAKALLERLPLFPMTDVAVMKEDGSRQVKRFHQLTPTDSILDWGDDSIQAVHDKLQEATSVIWNGPVGKFETQGFELGTQRLVENLAQHPAFVLVGGGETVEAFDRWAPAGSSHCTLSTGGGAFLTYLAGEPMPALEALTLHPSFER